MFVFVFSCSKSTGLCWSPVSIAHDRIEAKPQPVSACNCFVTICHLLGNTRLHFLILVTGCTSVGKILDAEVYKITATDFCPLQEETKEEERVTDLKKILNSGMFYFSWPNAGSNFDLTVRAQKQGDNHYEFGNSFFWLVLHAIPKSSVIPTCALLVKHYWRDMNFCISGHLLSFHCHVILQGTWP